MFAKIIIGTGIIFSFLVGCLIFLVMNVGGGQDE